MIAKDLCLSIGNIRSLIYINKLFRDTSAHQQYKTICETQTVQSKMRHTNSGVHDAQLLHYVTQHDSKAKHHGTLCKLQIIYSHITRMLQRNILKPSCTTFHKEGRPTLDLQHNKQITQLDVDGKRLEHTKDKRQLYR